MKRSREDSEAVKQKRKRRRDRKESGDSDADGLRLLKYAALGEARKVAKLAKRKHVNVDVMDVEGSTPLHQVLCLTQREAALRCRGACFHITVETYMRCCVAQACRHGHLPVVEVLLRCVQGPGQPHSVVAVSGRLIEARAGLAQMRVRRTCAATRPDTWPLARATWPS